MFLPALLLSACTTPSSETAETATPNEDCGEAEVLVGATYEPERSSCLVSESLDELCSTMQLGLPDSRCPTFEEHVEAIRQAGEVDCDGSWGGYTGGSSYIRACTGPLARGYQAFYSNLMSVDFAVVTDAIFDADGDLAYFRQFESGHIEKLGCCEGMRAWGGEAFGTYVDLDCTEVLDYQPRDLASCRGAGLPP